MRNFSHPNVLSELKKLHKLKMRNVQNIAHGERLLRREKYSDGNRAIDYRRARTRGLINVGGLLNKAGLVELFGIDLGIDPQTDSETFEGISALYGALLEFKASIDPENFNQQKMLWSQKGKAYLAQK